MSKILTVVYLFMPGVLLANFAQANQCVEFYNGGRNTGANIGPRTMARNEVRDMLISEQAFLAELAPGLLIPKVRINEDQGAQGRFERSHDIFRDRLAALAGQVKPSADADRSPKKIEMVATGGHWDGENVVVKLIARQDLPQSELGNIYSPKAVFAHEWGHGLFDLNSVVSITGKKLRELETQLMGLMDNIFEELRVDSESRRDIKGQMKVADVLSGATEGSGLKYRKSSIAPVFRLFFKDQLENPSKGENSIAKASRLLSEITNLEAFLADSIKKDPGGIYLPYAELFSDVIILLRMKDLDAGPRSFSEVVTIKDIENTNPDFYKIMDPVRSYLGTQLISSGKYTPQQIVKIILKSCNDEILERMENPELSRLGVDEINSRLLGKIYLNAMTQR